MANCPEWIADTIAASRELGFSNDDFSPNQKLQFLEDALKIKPATHAVLTQYKADIPLAQNRSFVGLCNYLEEQEENMAAALTRDAVGCGASPLLYTQADMDAAVLAPAIPTAAATFTKRGMDNAVARALLLLPSVSGCANSHTSDDPDPLAYRWLHFHTGHWGVNCNTLKKRRCETEPDQSLIPATLDAPPHHRCTRQHLHRTGAVSQVGQTLSPVPRQRICQAQHVRYRGFNKS
jgi:hypothetical protein